VNEIILINISGADKPGVTVSVTEVLASHQVNVLDIGQALIHDTLSLGMLIEVPEEEDSSLILKDILYRLHDRELSVRFTPVTEEEYSQWVSGQGKPRHIITLLARKITAQHLASLTAVVLKYDLNVDRIDRFQGELLLMRFPNRPMPALSFLYGVSCPITTYFAVI